MNKICLKSDGLYLNDEKFFLLSGDFHYFRTMPNDWESRLILMKDFGITAVTTYVAWNLHEPKENQFNFEGIADLGRFFQLADKVGLKVVLRCAPYMCAEWESGGLPAWLLKNRQMCVRSSDPDFIKPFTRYTEKLAEVVRPYLYTNGGPIILIGIENEYGSFGNDRKYLEYTVELYKKLGFNVPFISANGSDPFKFINGTLEGNWNGGDASANEGGVKTLLEVKELQPNLPPMAGEAWCGQLMLWGRNFYLNADIDDTVKYFKKALEMGAFINFYMFVGGTNFAFNSGAILRDEKHVYVPCMTSYDYDAPISENGVPREKYFAMRDVLDEFLGKPKRPRVVPEVKVQKINDIKFTEVAPLLENAQNIAEKSVFKYRTVCMEDLDQNSGFILYSTFVNYTDDRKRHVIIEDLHDRATLYFNGKYIGTVMRDEPAPDITFTVPKEGGTLQILVENLGHVNYGYAMYSDLKGILKCVRYEIENSDGSYLYNFAVVMGYDTKTLPLDDLSKLNYVKNADIQKNLPYFYRGEFKATPNVDTFLDTRKLNKGVIFVNGFNLGRFWNIGPQYSLYVPGCILKENNVIEILELHSTGNYPEIKDVDRCIFINDDKERDKFELL